MSPLNYNPTNLKNKTILITGGASGFGAAFSTRWASAGAQIIIGDINPSGAEIVAQIRTETSNPNIHFIHLDVTSWTSQVNFFRQAVQLSPHGGIDAVVANAGINNAAESRFFESPTIDYLSDPNPPPPSLKTVDVNLTGVLYTTHLAQWFLPRNPGSSNLSNESTETDESGRDRHLLLMGSIASLHALASQVPYTITKHAVLGLFRCLRIMAPETTGIRVNIVCPYYTDIGLMSGPARAILAGVPIGKPEDVVEAATYLMANQKCSGRSLATGPKLKLDLPEGGYLKRGEVGKYTVEEGGDKEEQGVWELELHDAETTDVFTDRMLKMVKTVVAAKGWIGWGKGMVEALLWPVTKYWTK